jgi:hypothetical protein
LPAIDPARWREIERSEHPAGPDDDAPFTTLAYEASPRERTPLARDDFSGRAGAPRQSVIK